MKILRAVVAKNEKVKKKNNGLRNNEEGKRKNNG